MKCFLFTIIFVLALAMGVFCNRPCKVTVCTKDIRPVCGNNGNCNKLFDNECLMKNYNCEAGEDFGRVNIEKCSSCCR